jgi:ATP-dependent helicase HrpB
MLTSDLAPLMLSLAQWGAGEPEAMAWIDPPPAAAMAAARAELRSLGALDGDGRITDHGRAMAALPMEPPLAHMLLFAADRGAATEAARIALLLQERGLGGRSDDLSHRLDRWNSDRSARADASRKLAQRWARRAEEMVSRGASQAVPAGVLLAEAFPDNICKRRDASGEHWLASGGRGLRLDPASPLARAEWLAVGDAQGEAKGARITGAIPLTEAEVLRWLGHRIERRSTLRWIADERRVEALVETRLGAVTISRGSDPSPDGEAVATFLTGRVRDGGLGLLPLSHASLSLLKRARFSGLEALSDDALLGSLEEWLTPLLGRRLDSVDKGRLHQALLDRLDWNERQSLDRLAPPEFVSPAGTHHAIDYEDEGGPSVEVRVQALFGLDRHPTFGQPAQPLLVKLTSPAGRPIQATRDLPGFWRGSWRDVVRDMKGRYPRHRWPDEPWAEDPSLKTRNAFEASKRS